jgi:hypothetical protein
VSTLSLPNTVRVSSRFGRTAPVDERERAAVRRWIHRINAAGIDGLDDA